MWHTSDGDRTLRGREAALFKAGLGSLVDSLAEFEADNSWPTGVGLFDKLTHAQKIALFSEVGTALLEDASGMPELNAVNEAAIAAVFEQIKGQIGCEVDADRCELRKLVVGILRREFLADDLELPDAKSSDVDEWESLVEGCADKILWDWDFDVSDLFLDAQPERAQALKEFLSIDEDYYVAIPSDPSPAQLKQHERNLKRLTAERRPPRR